MKKSILLIMSVICFAGTVSLPAGEILDLDACMNLALHNNIEIQRQMVSLRVAENERDNIWALFLPSMNISAGMDYSDTLFSESVLQQDALSYSGGISLSLGLNTGIPASIENIQLSGTLAELNYEDARKLLSSQVSTQFYRLIMLGEELELLAADLELARQLLAKSELQFSNGLIDEQVLLRARLNVESAKLSLQRSLSNYEQNELSFITTLGLPGGSDIELDGSIEPLIIDIDVEELVDSYLNRRSDVRLAELSIRQTETAAKSVRANTLGPTLSLSGRWNGSVSDFSDGGSDSLAFGVSVSLPLDSRIPGSRNDQSVFEADANIEKARLALSSVRDAAELEVRNLAASLGHSSAAIRIAGLQLEIAEKAYALADEGFSKGTVEQLDLEEIRGDLLSARQALLEEKYQYLVTGIELMNALNVANIDELNGNTGD